MVTVKDSLNKQVQVKQRIEILKRSVGWEDVEKYLTSRECKLLRLLRKGKREEIGSVRDRLNEIQDFKEFLAVALSDGAKAIDELATYDKQFGEMR